jgi:peptidoglycan/LPS O-acetylase OafA/YrhL
VTTQVGKERKVGLDALRSVAILAVLLCHFLAIYLNVRGRWSYPAGVLGVELFFVLSGYLIGSILLKTVFNSGSVPIRTLIDFWVRRWLRTIPNYLLFLGLAWWMATAVDWKTLTHYLTFTQNLIHPTGKFFAVSWSLAIEEWFYLSLPALIFALGIFGGGRRFRLLSAIAVLFVSPVLIRLLFGTGLQWDAEIRKVVIMRMDAIMWGVIIALIERENPVLFRTLQRKTVFWTGVLVTGAVFAGLTFRYPPNAADFTCAWGDTFWFCGFSLGCALMIPFCAAINRLWKPAHFTAQQLSLWSYSIYLCHLPLMTLTSVALGGILPGFMLPFICAASILMVSAFVYYYFEAPIMRLRDPICRLLGSYHFSEARETHAAKRTLVG